MIRSTEHLEILNEIARIATTDLELRPMLQRITDTLMRSFGWPFVACVSVDFERGTFVCEALSTLVAIRQDDPPAYQRAIRQLKHAGVRLRDLEREAFLSLLGERKTLERIEHTLKTGKPLRN